MFVASMVMALASSTPDCNPLPGWERVAEASDGKVLIFGETHGTSEAPAAVAEYICAAGRGRRMLLAIEFGSPMDAAFRAAWAGPHQGFRERLINAVPEWEAREDGVSSVAMLDMLQRLHGLREAGWHIDLTAFNGERDELQRAQFEHLPGQEGHEAAQAANIRAAMEAGAYHQTVVLVGSLHAGKKRVELPTGNIRTMAMLVAPPDYVVSLALAHDGGQSWSCQLASDAVIEPGKPITDEMIECTAFDSGPAPRGAAAPGMALESDDDAYDGIFHVGPISASPPATVASQ